MTVKELKEILDTYPDDAFVFGYHEQDECDGLIDKITYDTMCEEYEDGEVYHFSPHYCQADSEAEVYWNTVGRNVPVVFLHCTNTFHDFTKYKKEK